MEDSLAVERTLEHHSELLKSTDPEQAAFWQGLADRLRALRERDDKRWEDVAGVTREIKMASLLSSPPVANQELLRIWADRLREAREGK